MLSKSTRTHTLSAAVLEPDLVADVKKAERKQAIVERFAYRPKAATPEAKPRKRSPYWQSVDEEC